MRHTCLLLMLGIVAPSMSLAAAPPPLDYLVPPPLPAATAAISPPATRLHPAPRPANSLPSESRTVPHYAFPNGQAFAKNVNEPGLISRMARWFGFANENYAQDSQGAATNNHHYYYPKPQQQGSGSKEPCNLCNKYPWVPMMHNSVQYPWDPSKQQQLAGQGHLYKQPPVPQLQHAASNLKQRAVQFLFPPAAAPPPPSHAGHHIPQQIPNKGGPEPQSHHQVQYSSGPFIPIPIPSLSNSAQPPIYNARPFNQPTAGQSTQFTPQTYHPQHPSNSPSSLPATQQQLPSTEAAHFTDAIASAHSEIHLDTVIPTQIPPSTQNNEASFEIIKSHQVADYISSVEYPPAFVQTQAFDVQSTSSSLAGNHQTDHKPVVNTGRYQHSTLSPYLNQHIPASQILTEPGSFVLDNQYQQSTLPAQVYDQNTTIYESQDHGYDIDNFVAASVKNNSIHAEGNSYDTWTLETNDFVYATTTPEVYTQTETEATTTLRPDFYSTTTESVQSNDVEFVASVQTSKQMSSTKLWPQKPRDRETPKRMLDSPIQHLNGGLGAPRPFTRDPADLGLRAVANNHKFYEETGHRQNSLSPTSPTPTSTYSSIDASGHYAGMSPPAVVTQANRQPFIPFTTKVQPRPFEPTKNASDKPPATPSFSDWIQAQNSDLHTPAETMLVNVKLNPITTSTTTTTTVKPRPTKYLTKILASNIRELLQREHTPSTKLKQSPNSLSFDLQALQKNIDDWTEQEYTSLSHRPSTPTILGRSKHIPKEYLPSTTTTIAATKSPVKPQRQSKTTKGFLDTSELSASVNSLEPLYERKHFQFTAISDNHLQETYDSREVSKYQTTTTAPTTTPMVTTTSTTSTSTTTTTRRPFYQQGVEEIEPEELWRKAKVSISPKTKEKVYVVTPQPIFFPQRQISSTSTTTTERPFSGFGSGFKSPRFLVRPTPGNVTASNLLKILGTESNNNNSNSNKGKYRFDLSQEVFSNSFFLPDHVGLRGLSAYVPSEPVEIIDGNSKVLKTIKSPKHLESSSSTSHNIMDLTKERQTAPKKKTMEPSPR
uniref:Mucin-5AC n=1 Tax=Musca domestica TaxID=7370 RepID=A0A1I8MV28_MUSDO